MPTGIGHITHIEEEMGFDEGGLNVFVLNRMGDYHKDMNAHVFEQWFAVILK